MSKIDLRLMKWILVLCHTEGEIIASNVSLGTLEMSVDGEGNDSEVVPAMTGYSEGAHNDRGW